MSSQAGIVRSITPSEAAMNSMTGNNNSSSVYDHDLPIEMITEILSWLPVNSVLRFKSVCELWLLITEDPGFIHTHMTRSTQWTNNHRRFADGYGIINYLCQLGLVLEMETRSWARFRLRNPSTKRVLDLPYPGCRHACCMIPHYISRTRTLKIAFPAADKTFKILTVGVDYRWRKLSIPFACSFDFLMPKFLTLLIDGVYFVLALAKEPPEEEQGGLVLVCLEMGNETLWRVDIPRDDGGGGGLLFSNWRFLQLINWDGKPAIARSLANCERYVRVLEDYKNQKWAKDKIVTDLGSVTSDDGTYHLAYIFDASALRTNRDHEEILNFEALPRVRRHQDAARGTKSSLVGFKGMKPASPLVT